jgi:threonine/homoserine/homoserine lactone efflux protein
MGQALGQVLPLAVAIAIFPVPVIAAVLIVGSERGRVKALAYALAWCVGLAAVGAAVLVFAGAADATEKGERGDLVNLLLLALGMLLVVVAARKWQSRPSGEEEPPMPGWMEKVGDLSAVKAAGVGFALSGLNPKNVGLSVAAAAEIAYVGIHPVEQGVVLAAFVLLGSVGVLAPLVLSVALGERSQATLQGLSRWMARYNAVIMAVLMLLIGATLIGDAVSGFSG